MCTECREDQFKCDNDRCISAQRVCDGYDSCRDLSDELNCSEWYISVYQSTHCMWRTPVRSEKVVKSLSTKLRGLPNVPPVLWHCWLGVRKSSRPVKFEWWGVYESSTLTTRLPSHPTISLKRVSRQCVCDDCVACSEDQFKCRNTGRCIWATSVCDTINNCGDWSDENCSQ